MLLCLFQLLDAYPETFADSRHWLQQAFLKSNPENGGFSVEAATDLKASMRVWTASTLVVVCRYLVLWADPGVPFAHQRPAAHAAPSHHPEPCPVWSGCLSGYVNRAIYITCRVLMHAQEHELGGKSQAYVS